MKSIDGAKYAYQLLDIHQKVRQGLVTDLITDKADELLFQAIANQASDIHLEPHEEGLRVRYRIDGVLYDQPQISFEQKSLVISRLKVLSALDIAQQRVPQDGKFRVSVSIDDGTDNKDYSNTVIDLRVATFPSIHGEKMVIRILDRCAQHIRLEELGLNEHVYHSLKKIIKKPYGLFLTTGPTGSGKTTTLYALLSQLHSSQKNIVTMEDPVEYNLAGITQSQVNVKAGFSFENGLRALLRQDPDVIMIGEIRDVPTATIAIEAGLTGHVVLSTLHTSDSAGAVTRLLEMGVESFLVSATLNGVVAQRLVRLLCPMCKEQRALSEQEQERAAAYGWKLSVTYHPVGCNNCMHTGYTGRSGVFELLVMNDELRDLIMSKTSSRAIRALAIRSGMQILTIDALQKLKVGLISFEEFLRLFID